MINIKENIYNNYMIHYIQIIVIGIVVLDFYLNKY